MRQIEKQMLSAIHGNRDWRNDNTQVRTSDTQIEILLHEHCVCRILKSNSARSKLIISSCGWRTRTTKSRINAILSAFDRGQIWQKKGEWFWTYSGRGETVDFVDGMECEI